MLQQRVCIPLKQAYRAHQRNTGRSKRTRSLVPVDPLVAFAHYLSFSPPLLSDLMLLSLDQTDLEALTRRIESMEVGLRQKSIISGLTVLRRTDFGAYQITRVRLLVYYEERFWGFTDWICPHMRNTQVVKTGCLEFNHVNFEGARQLLLAEMIARLRGDASIRLVHIKAYVTVRNVCPARGTIHSYFGDNSWRTTLAIPAIRLDGTSLGRCLQFTLFNRFLVELQLYHAHAVMLILRRLLAVRADTLPIYYPIDRIRLRHYSGSGHRDDVSEQQLKLHTTTMRILGYGNDFCSACVYEDELV